MLEYLIGGNVWNPKSFESKATEFWTSVSNYFFGYAITG